MSDLPASTSPNLTPREHRWLTALLILATLAFGFVVVDYVGKWITYFSDVIMIFFLAWLLAFILSPIANGLVHLFPRLPRALAVIDRLFAADRRRHHRSACWWPSSSTRRSRTWSTTGRPSTPGCTTSCSRGRTASTPSAATRSTWTTRSGNCWPTSRTAPASSPSRSAISPSPASASSATCSSSSSCRCTWPSTATGSSASFSDSSRPPTPTRPRLLEHSISRSFGGFLRGQALMGLLYGVISMLASVLLGLPYMPVTAATSGILQAIPFFGPFVSWTPPVLVALFFKPGRGAARVRSSWSPAGSS